MSELPILAPDDPRLPGLLAIDRAWERALAIYERIHGHPLDLRTPPPVGDAADHPADMVGTDPEDAESAA